MTKRIRKAVFPVAGLGTRFLPATKSIPKEMLTVVDRPILQHVVEEAYEAGIEHCIFVTGRNKAVIEDYFDMAYELEDILLKRGKTKEWQALKADLPGAGAMSFTRQQAPLGLGHAVWCARDIVGDEPFAVVLPDMLTMAAGAEARCLAQCVAAYEKHGGNIIAVEEVPPEETHQYGVVSVGKDFGLDVRDHRHGGKAAARARRRPISSSPAAMCLRRKFSKFSKRARRAPAAKSSSPTA